MRSDKNMNIIISIILVFFTIIQVFYFADISVIPSSIISTNVLITIIIYVSEIILLVGLSILITYLLPIICIVKFAEIKLQLKSITLPINTRVQNSKREGFFLYNKIYQRLQVIRC